MAFVGRRRDACDAVKRSRTSLEVNRDSNSHINSRQNVLHTVLRQSPLLPCPPALNSGPFLSRDRAHKRSSSVETTTEAVNASLETCTRANRPIPRPFRPSSDPFSVISISFPGSETSNHPRRSLATPSPRLTSFSPLPRAVSRPYPRLSLPSDASSPLRRLGTTEAIGETGPLQSSSTAESSRDAPLPCQSSIFLPSSANRIPLSSLNAHLLLPRAQRPVIQEPFHHPSHSPLKSFPRHVFNARHYRKPFPSLFVP